MVEGVTDETGTLRLPAQEFWPCPFFLDTHYGNPSMWVLKPGYDMRFLQNTRRRRAEQAAPASLQQRQLLRAKRLRLAEGVFRALPQIGEHDRSEKIASALLRAIRGGNVFPQRRVR